MDLTKTRWRIEFAEAMTDKTVDTFECEIEKLTRFIGKAGQLAGSVPILSVREGKRLAPILGGEGHLTAYVYWGEDIWWGGFLDYTNLVSNSFGAELTFEGTSFEVYPERREVRTNEAFTAMEQTEYARWLWEYMQKGRGGNLLISTSFPPVVSKKRDMSWKRSEAKTVGSILKEMSNRVDGFEWMIDVYSNEGVRHRDLLVGYPAIGRPDWSQELTYPGTIMEYSIEGSALEGATSFQGRGKAPDPVGTPNPKGDASTAKGSEEREPIMSSKIFDADDLLDAGYIRTDSTVDRDSVTVVETLNDWAELARDMRSGPLVLPQVKCRMDGLSQALLGSTVKLRINDFPFPAGPNGEPGYEHSARCIGYEINPGEYGAPDVLNVTFENPYSDEAMNRIPA